MTETEVKIVDNYFSTDIYIVQDSGFGKVRVFDLLTKNWKEFDIHAVDIQPSISLPKDIAEKIAEGLSKIGVKTTNDHKLAGILEAKEAHLQDMRKLVFGSKGVSVDAPTKRT